MLPSATHADACDSKVRGSSFTESNVIVHRNKTGAKKNVNHQHKDEQKPMLTTLMSGNALQILQDSPIFLINAINSEGLKWEQQDTN